jgi:hypothetical protein
MAMRHGRGILIALVAGLVLVGLAAVLVRVSDVNDFYKACFWLGVMVAGLAVAALYSLAQAMSRVEHRPGGDPRVQEGFDPPSVGVTDTERRNAGWGSVYLAVAAVPCLMTAALHYWV